jgi:hypothetical protein
MIRFSFIFLLLAAATTAQLPDLRSVPADLTVPALTDGAPAPGKRVKHWLPEHKGTQLYHVLYLPTDWKADAKFPVIVEYAGNGGYSNKFGDVSLGVPEGSKLGYGISAGKGFVWICVPYVAPGATNVCTRWWGDADATTAYCRKAVRMVCEQFGGDPSAVVLTGFSRGAIACGYLGLRDDETAKLWRAFIPYSHYDGLNKWPYPASDATSAYVRLKRLNGRPTFYIHEGPGDNMRKFLAAGGVTAPFTLQPAPFRNHNDEWILRDTPTRTKLRTWLAEVLAKETK